MHFVIFFFIIDFASFDGPELIELGKISCLSSPTSIIGCNVSSDSSCSSLASPCSTLLNATFPPFGSHESSLSLATSSSTAFHLFSPTLVLPQPSGLSPRPLQPIIETIDDLALEQISEQIWTDAISQYLRQLEEEEEEEEDDDEEENNEDCERQPQRSLKRKHE